MTWALMQNGVARLSINRPYTLCVSSAKWQQLKMIDRLIFNLTRQDNLFVDKFVIMAAASSELSWVTTTRCYLSVAASDSDISHFSLDLRCNKWQERLSLHSYVKWGDRTEGRCLCSNKSCNFFWVVISNFSMQCERKSHIIMGIRAWDADCPFGISGTHF